MSRPPKDAEADFLSRWSRRKNDARHAPEEPEAAAPPPAAAEDAPQKSEAEILEELDLPDPDTLGPGSDFRAFMAEAVPDFIRRKALRRLWGTNPVLANLDMLVDYGEDYTDKARVVANLQTAYRAGRGYLDRIAEPEPEPAAAEEDVAAAEGPADAPEEPTAAPDEPESEEAAAERAPAGDETPEAAETDAPPNPPANPPAGEEAPAHTTLAEMPPRRRMRFDFDD